MLGDWVSYPGPLFVAPIGATFAGDVHLTGGLPTAPGAPPGELEIDGLELSAPGLGTGPRIFRGCRMIADAGGLAVLPPGLAVRPPMPEPSRPESGAPTGSPGPASATTPGELSPVPTSMGGQPVGAPIGVPSLTPPEAADYLRANGLCHVFRYTYPIDDAGRLVGETWCIPPSGTIRTTTVGPSGELVVFVDDTRIRAPRSQPSNGWGC